MTDFNTISDRARQKLLLGIQVNKSVEDRRSRAAWVAALAIFVGLLLTGCGGAHRQVEAAGGSGYSGRCGDFNQQIEKFWSAADQEEARTATLKAKPEDGERFIEQVGQGISRNAAAWVKAQEARCDSDRGPLGGTSNQASQRAFCLDDALVMQEALVEVTKEGALTNLYYVAYTLADLHTKIQDCSEPAGWVVYEEQPLGDEVWAERKQVARARILRRLAAQQFRAEAESLLKLVDESSSPQVRISALIEGSLLAKGQEQLSSANIRALQARGLIRELPGPSYLALEVEILISGVMMEQNRREAAIELLNELIAVNAEILGQHPQLGEAFAYLGLAHSMLKNKEQLLEVYNKALAVDIAAFGERSPAAGRSMLRVGMALLANKNNLAAYKQLTKAVQTLERWGDNSLELGGSLSHLGLAQERLQHFDAAYDSYIRALNVFKASPIRDSVQIAASVSGVGRVMIAQGHSALAVSVLEDAVRFEEKAWGTEGAAVGNTRIFLGLALLNSLNNEEAHRQFTRGLAILQAANIEMSERVALGHYGLGIYHRLNGDSVQATSFFKRSLFIYREVLGVAAPECQTVLDELSELCKAGHAEACELSE